VLVSEVYRSGDILFLIERAVGGADSGKPTRIVTVSVGARYSAVHSSASNPAGHFQALGNLPGAMLQGTRPVMSLQRLVRTDAGGEPKNTVGKPFRYLKPITRDRPVLY